METLNENALRAAEVIFHRAAGGQSGVGTAGPKAYGAEVDADLMEWAIGASKRMAEARERAIREIATRWPPSEDGDHE